MTIEIKSQNLEFNFLIPSKFKLKLLRMHYKLKIDSNQFFSGGGQVISKILPLLRKM